MTALSNFITHLPILSAITFLPLVGALLILMLRGEAEVVARQSRYVALWTTLFTFVLSLLIWIQFENGTANFQLAPVSVGSHLDSVTRPMHSMIRIILSSRLTVSR